MNLKKEKKDKIAVRPSVRRGEIAVGRPNDLWTEMDQIFDEFKSSFDTLLWPWSHSESVTTPVTAMTYRRTPPMDIADLGDKYEIHLEMPGIPRDDINIEVTPTSIEISTQQEETREDKGENWLRRERNGMSFYRALELPEEVITDDAEAELKDGILTVIMPKVEPKPERKAKKVKIK